MPSLDAAEVAQRVCELRDCSLLQHATILFQHLGCCCKVFFFFFFG